MTSAELDQAAFDLEEKRIKLKIRKLGTIQFIGELFKLKILKMNLMFVVFEEILCEKDDAGIEYIIQINDIITNSITLFRKLPSFKLPISKP